MQHRAADSLLRTPPVAREWRDAGACVSGPALQTLANGLDGIVAAVDKGVCEAGQGGTSRVSGRGAPAGHPFPGAVTLARNLK